MPFGVVNSFHSLMAYAALTSLTSFSSFTFVISMAKSTPCPIIQCRCTTSLDILCTDKHLKEVPTLKPRPNTATGHQVAFNVFDLTGNDIVQIPAFAFRGLKLSAIHIENNPLIGISPNAFSWENSLLFVIQLEFLS